MQLIQNPEPLNLSTILGQSRLEIPKYQRSYSWTSVQVDEFLSDLFESFENKQGWFLGILYTYPKPGSSLANLTMLLDGQQRITTTFILLKELMLFHENLAEPETRNELQLAAIGSLTSCIFLPGSENPRLQLDLANNDIFLNYLKGQDKSTAIIKYLEKSADFAASHKLLRDAVARIRERLSKFHGSIEPSEKVVERFKDLVKYVLLQIELIEIQVSGDETIYKIFENINDRGLHLSASDKFKNLHCSLLDSAHIEAFEKEWFDVNRAVHSLGLDIDKNFFDFYFRSVGIDDEGDFYKYFRNNLKSSKAEKLKESNRTFSGIKDMVRIAKAVKNVKLTEVLEVRSTPTLDRLSKVVSAVVNLGWKTSDQLRVLIFASFFAFKDRKDVTEFQTFLANLLNSVRFYVSATLLGTKGNAIRPFTIDIAGQLKSKKSVATAVHSKDSLNFPGKFSSKNIDVLSFSDNDLSSLCLMLVQAARNVEPIRSHDTGQSWSLEHLIPKSYEENWSSLESSKFARVSSDKGSNLLKPLEVDDLRKKNKHRLQEFLGNKFYIDLGQNKLAKNKSLKDKQAQYVKYGKPLSMPNFAPFRRIDEFTSFGVKEIVTRSNELYDLLVNELRNIDLPNTKLKK